MKKIQSSFGGTSILWVWRLWPWSNLFRVWHIMVKVTIPLQRLIRAGESAIFEWVLLLVDKIVAITPRDLARPPKDLSQTVSGDLKRSIWFAKQSSDHYVVGVKWSRIPFKWNEITKEKWVPPNVYGGFLEFGTVRMKPRSFIRKGLYDNYKAIVDRINTIFNQLTGRW